MKMMPYGVAAALLLGGSILVPPAKAWQSESDRQSSSVQPAESQANSGPSVRDVQQELKQAGLYNGAIDGVWGAESRSAMQQYQKQRGLYASGQLDHDTLQAMRGSDSVTQSGSSGGDSASSDVGIGGGASGASRDLGNDKGDDEGNSFGSNQE